MLKSIEPYFAFNDPNKIWQETPANLVLEIQFLILFALCTYDAWWSSRNALKRIAWLMALFCGVLIELLTILPTSIGNFYHSQFTLMLFDHREPFYMLPCLYVWCLYTVPTTLWHCSLGHKLAEYALTVIMVFLLWQPLDLLGIHFQFWTWHNSEPLYVERRGGVPITSTYWMMAYIGGMQLCLSIVRDHYFYARRRSLKQGRRGGVSLLQCVGLAIVASVVNTVVFMNLPFNLLFYRVTEPAPLGLGLDATTALHAYLGLCVAVLVVYVLSRVRFAAIRVNPRLFFDYVVVIGIGYVAVSLAMMHGFEVTHADGTPRQQSTYHQVLALNGTQVREESFFGVFERDRYVIKNEVDPMLYDFERH